MNAMMKVGKLFFVLLFSILSFVKVFAIDAPMNLDASETQKDSVSLSWDSVEGSMAYFVYYSKQPATDLGYDNQEDFVEDTAITISGLDAGTDYYFAVVAMDENGNESLFSPEAMFSTLPGEEVMESEGANLASLELSSIEVIDYSKLELTFSADLDNSENATREFKIVNKADALNELEVLSTELNEEDHSKLILNLAEATVANTEYELVVIAISDIHGRNIESGIDGLDAFIAPEYIEVVVEEENSSEVSEESIEPTEDLSAAPNEEANIAGVTLAESDVEPTVTSVALENNKLPDTGPEHIFLFILTFILGTLVYVFKFKRL